MALWKENAAKPTPAPMAPETARNESVRTETPRFTESEPFAQSSAPAPATVRWTPTGAASKFVLTGKGAPRCR